MFEHINFFGYILLYDLMKSSRYGIEIIMRVKRKMMQLNLNIMKMRSVLLVCGILYSCLVNAGIKTLWNIGVKNNSSAEFALAPDKYNEFLANDFGYEDRYFLVGYSQESESFPYVLPGPRDVWGGTGGMAGIRINDMNILFGIRETKSEGIANLIVRTTDAARNNAPVLKVLLNGEQIYNGVVIGKGTEETLKKGPVEGAGSEIKISFPVEKLKKGGNEITLTIWEGSWIMFDNIELEVPEGLKMMTAENLFVRNISPADYELKVSKKRFQPLLVDIEHLSGKPLLQVYLDGKNIFEERPDTGRYIYEVPMPAVKKQKNSKYAVYVNRELYQEGMVLRSPQSIQTAADYIDTRMGSAHSRWMIAPGPWMPFSMVKLSPDNQNPGWQSGYQPSIESIGTFSHIHEWTMAGLGLFPTNGKLVTRIGKENDPDGYRSRIDRSSEEAPIGYYKVKLTDYDILAELTATTRCGFQRYTYPKDGGNGRVMIDFKIPAEYGYEVLELQVKQVSDYRIEGYSHQLSKGVWGADADQDYTLFFVIEFDRPIIKTGGWLNDIVTEGKEFAGNNLKSAGLYVEFDVKKNPVVQLRTGVSLVSVENASLNLETEITQPFNWSFDAVRNNQLNVWNDLLERVKVESNDFSEKKRFYNNMYRSICSRNIWSDVNGEWRDAGERIRKFDNPDHVALGCDAFWNTFWNLNQFWNLVVPEWSNRWVNSQLAMYDAGGWLAKGPAGMEYVPVMVAEHEIPLIVGAYQMGIRDYDVQKAFEAVKKMQTTSARKVDGGFAGNRDLEHYLKYKFVPADLGRFSNTLEYSYDDWTVAQFAKSLNKPDEYKTFIDRGYWWKNAIEPDSGYAQLRNSDGCFVTPFDPFTSGRNAQYVEGNAWQLSYFVPQDVPALIDIIGREKFIKRLDWGFQVSESVRYNAPNDKYWDYPVVQGNQQSMHFAFLFNWAGEPWLTQKWSRSVIDRYYGKGIGNAYLGDEDQGQMSAWMVMASLGLFQTDGGCRVDPVYEIASPLFSKAVIDLGKRFGRGNTFTIEAKDVSRKNKYVQSAILNGKPLNNFWFPARELLKGGTLILQMGETPNKNWGVGRLPD